MFREYFVVARYIANIPEGADIDKFVLDQVSEDLVSSMKNSEDNLKSFLDATFSVLPGEEVDIDEFEDEE